MRIRPAVLVLLAINVGFGLASVHIAIPLMTDYCVSAPIEWSCASCVQDWCWDGSAWFLREMSCFSAGGNLPCPETPETSPTPEIGNRLRPLVVEGLDRFKRDTGRYPTTKEGLSSLARNPKLNGWSGPYIRFGQIVKDFFEYESEPPHKEYKLDAK